MTRMTPMDHRDRSLQDILRRVAAEDATLGVSPDVEARLRAVVRDRRRRQRRFTLLSVAASIAVVALVWRAFPAPRDTSTAAHLEPPPAALPEFLPLRYATVPAGDGRIVRLTVAREALASFGLDPRVPGVPAVVVADVFVGEDGLARSVRFVEPALEQEQIP